MQATRASGLPFGVIVSRLALAWMPDFDRSADADALAVVAGFRVVDRCPQINVQTLLVRFTPPAAEENLGISELNAQEAAFALAADYVVLDIDHIFGAEWPFGLNKPAQSNGSIGLPVKSYSIARRGWPRRSLLQHVIKHDEVDHYSEFFESNMSTMSCSTMRSAPMA